MLTNQKGITLIALIITIIVMLILVGVTINVALNGGLFQKADDATKLTQEAADKEELQLEIVTAYNEKEGTVDLNLLKTNLEKRNWKDVTISGDKLTCATPKGNTFTVAADGKISEGGTNTGGGAGGNGSTIAYGKKYFMIGESDSYIIFLQDGTTGGTARPKGVTEITYEVKIESGKNVVYASLDGAEAIQYGIFNENFTEFKTTVGEEFLFRLEGVIPDVYNIAYESDYAEIALYKNGMVTIKIPLIYPGTIWTGTYDVEGNQLIVNAWDEKYAFTTTVSDDWKSFVVEDTGASILEGIYNINNSKTDNYNPIYNSNSGKEIYKSSLYINGDKNNAITIGDSFISLEQSNVVDVANLIDLSKFYNGEANERITVEENGTKITYNGETYTLITKAQINTAAQ